MPQVSIPCAVGASADAEIAACRTNPARYSARLLPAKTCHRQRFIADMGAVSPFSLCKEKQKPRGGVLPPPHKIRIEVNANGNLPLGGKGGQPGGAPDAPPVQPPLISAAPTSSMTMTEYSTITRKQGLVWQEVFLPDVAPPAWQDREVLWNAVEENEKTKDSRLAREFVVALPIELSLEQWQTLLTDFVQNQFVADGMCADLAIHDLIHRVIIHMPTFS